jgi:hypothetical protein
LGSSVIVSKAKLQRNDRKLLGLKCNKFAELQKEKKKNVEPKSACESACRKDTNQYGAEGVCKNARDPSGVEPARV